MNINQLITEEKLLSTNLVLSIAPVTEQYEEQYDQEQFVACSNESVQSTSAVQNPDGQDEIKKAYQAAQAMALALQKIIDANNENIKYLEGTRYNLALTTNILEQSVKEMPEGPAKEEAKKALAAAKTALDALDGDITKLKNTVASEQQELSKTNWSVSRLQMLSWNPNPSDQDMAEAQQLLEDVKKVETSINALQPIFDGAYQDAGNRAEEVRALNQKIAGLIRG